MLNPIHPQIPPVSQKNAPAFSSDPQRINSAFAFSHGSATYHDVRPGYPAEIVELAAPSHRVLDVGCGTGKLTSSLLDNHHEVFALDPSMDMLKQLNKSLPRVPCWQATAEHTALKSNSMDLISCAQTWHWLDVDKASAEFSRILKPNGAVLLAWNNLDTSVSWVHRLSRIMHAGDVLRSGFLPLLGNPWEISKEVRTTWTQELTPAQIIELAHTRSYWLAASEKTRQRVDKNLDWYLHEHCEFLPGELVALPYRCDGFLLTRQ